MASASADFEQAGVADFEAPVGHPQQAAHLSGAAATRPPGYAKRADDVMW